MKNDDPSKNYFADLTTVQLSCHLHICDHIESLESQLGQTEFWEEFN